VKASFSQEDTLLKKRNDRGGKERGFLKSAVRGGALGGLKKNRQGITPTIPKKNSRTVPPEISNNKKGEE